MTSRPSAQPGPPPDPPEAFVWWLWEQGRAGRSLPAIDGRTVQVVYPGRRWGSWGPDFRGALIAVDGTLVRGDVEVHVRARDWAAHGHGGDPEYGGLVLHVLFHPPPSQPLPFFVPTVALAPHLVHPLAQLWAEWQVGVQGPLVACATPQAAEGLLRRAGLARLEAKAARFEGDLAARPAAEGLLAGLIEGLGYAANVTPMRRWLERLPPVHLLDLGRVASPLELAAWLFGSAGLLPSLRGRRPLDAYSQAVERAWAALGRAGGRPEELGWRWRGWRPANHPVRRVAAVLALAPEAGRGLEARLLAALAELPPPRAGPALAALLGCPGDPYWQAHADFGQPLARPAAVLGRARAADLVVNVVLPWALALARRRDDSSLEAAVHAAYLAHPPLAENQITRHMARQVLGPPQGRPRRTAALQQGLIHLYQGWCEARDCGLCPAGGQGPPQVQARANRPPRPTPSAPLW